MAEASNTDPAQAPAPQVDAVKEDTTMEIHKPKPVHNWRELMTEIGVVVIRSVAEADRPGIRVAAVRGHASTATWLRVVKRATPVYADSFEGAVELLRNGQADAFASNREMLLEYSSHLSGSRVLEDSYQSGFAGVEVAKGNAARLAFVSEVLDNMKRSGSLRRIINELGLRGVDVVPS